MSRPTSNDRPERPFEAEDINPEIVAAIDEVQGRRTLELEAESAKAERQRGRLTRGTAIAAMAIIAGFAYYALR